MRPAVAFLAVPSLLAACAGQEPADNSQCVMREVADMPVLSDRGQPIVKVGINGTPVAFMVDTGAHISTVTPEAVDALRLPVDRSHYAILNGIGGATFAYKTTVDMMDLGTAAAHKVDLWEAGSFGHRKIDGLPLDGLFGADFLANYEVEFDLPAHHVSLYLAHNCNKDFPQPWEGLVYKQAFQLEDETAIRFVAQLDGKPVRMQLDSGALTLFDLDAAASTGATPSTMAGDRKVMTHGIDGNPMPAYIHRFGSFQIGRERVTPFWSAVADIQSSPLLGADFLRNHRVWVSYAHQFFWVQPVMTSLGDRSAAVAPRQAGQPGSRVPGR